MKSKYIKTGIKVIISVFFLWWVIYATNWNDVLRYLKMVTWYQMLIFSIVLVLGMAISAYKWKLLAEAKGLKYSFKEYFKIYLTGIFINNFMPSFVAGDAYKAYRTSGAEKKYSEAGSAVMMDRITGLLAATILALIFSVLNFKLVMGSKTLLLMNLLLLISLGIDSLLLIIRKTKKIKEFIKQFLPHQVTQFIGEVYSYNQYRRTVWKAVFVGMIFSFVGVAVLNYILFLSLNIPIGFFQYLSVIFIISIISSVPISINNIGVKEWAYITLFGVFGIASAPLVTVALINRFVQMIISFLALPIYLESQK